MMHVLWDQHTWDQLIWSVQEHPNFLDNMGLEKCTYLETLLPPYFPVIFVHIWMLGWQIPAHYLWPGFTCKIHIKKKLNVNAKSVKAKLYMHFLLHLLSGSSRHTETILMFDRFMPDQSPLALCLQEFEFHLFYRSENQDKISSLLELNQKPFRN